MLRGAICCGLLLALTQFVWAADPNITITKQPIVDKTQTTQMDFKWANCVGIKRIQVDMLKKDNKGEYAVVIGEKFLPTIQPTAKQINWTSSPELAQPAMTPVRLRIRAYGNGDTVIAEKWSQVVVLP
jgi:hypothetical protein